MRMCWRNVDPHDRCAHDTTHGYCCCCFFSFLFFFYLHSHFFTRPYEPYTYTKITLFVRTAWGTTISIFGCLHTHTHAHFQYTTWNIAVPFSSSASNISIYNKYINTMENQFSSRDNIQTCEKKYTCRNSIRKQFSHMNRNETKRNGCHM